MMGICQSKSDSKSTSGSTPKEVKEAEHAAPSQAADPAKTGAATTSPSVEEGGNDRQQPKRNISRETSTVYREQLINLHAKYKGMNAAEKEHLKSASQDDDNLLEQSGHNSIGNEKPSTKMVYQRFQNVFAAPLKMVEDFVAPIFPKGHEDVKFLEQVLEDNFIFSGLTHNERTLLIEAMQAHKSYKGEKIIKQGDIGDYFYVLKSGQVDFTVDGLKVGQAFAGASFGELALLYDAPRAATVTVVSDDCHLFRVDQQTFRTMLANNKIQDAKKNIDVLKRVEFFHNIDEGTLAKISDAMNSIKFHNGDYIVRKGEEGEVFYIIKTGEVKITDIGLGDTKYVDQKLGVGDFFGERALLTGEKRAANVISVGDSTILTISKDVFEKILGSLEALIERATDKRTLMGIPIFAKAKLEPYEIENLARSMIKVTFKKGEILTEEGKPLSGKVARGIYLISEGELTNQSKAGGVNILHRGDYAGQALIHYEEGTPTPTTVTCTQDTVCKLLTLEAIKKALGGLDRLERVTSLMANKLNPNINLDTLKKVTILGAGTFGQVWLVRDKKDKNTTYALKIQCKKELIKHGQAAGVIREKNLMASIEHPFVIRLVNAFQDEYNLYMVMSLAQGGELFSVIHTQTSDGVPEKAAKFYAANIYDGLMHMHSKNILYRDLKPENVLLDNDGYCILIDLGFAKVVTDKTYTLCGTPLYLAPEILLSRGYDTSVDNWSFGVLVYEMLLGYSPFYTQNIDQMELYKRIVKIRYTFPNWSDASAAARDIIKKILVLKPTERLGGLKDGGADIRNHPWLADLTPDDMIHKRIKAPWKPKVKDPSDVSNFDNWDHLEDKGAHRGAPPSKHDQEIFQDF